MKGKVWLMNEDICVGIKHKVGIIMYKRWGKTVMKKFKSFETFSIWYSLSLRYWDMQSSLGRVDYIILHKLQNFNRRIYWVFNRKYVILFLQCFLLLISALFLGCDECSNAKCNFHGKFCAWSECYYTLHIKLY
jgi:hypothetical protein